MPMSFKYVMITFYMKSLISSYFRSTMSTETSASCAPSQSKRLSQIEGYKGKKNDIIFHPSVGNSTGAVIYFGGDVQDYTENMLAHRDNKRHVSWNLESTAFLLHQHFPNSEVFIVKPSQMHLKTFSCYENFVQGNVIGAPEHSIDTDSLQHLKLLYKNAKLAASALSLKFDPGSCAQSIEGNLCSAINNHLPLTLIGFSKGCVVLNQLLHSYLALVSEPDKELSNFVNCIKVMYWLDGGHSGGSNTWMTNKSLLENFSKLNILVRIHVTPYQMYCDTRPWIGKEEKIFRETLRRLGANIERTLHFEEEPRSLENHFRVLEAFAVTKSN